MDVKAKDGTLLHVAAQIGHLDIIKLLKASKHGWTDQVLDLLGDSVNVNAQTKRGKIALYLAAKHGHIKIVKLLLEAKRMLSLQQLEVQLPLWMLHYVSTEI